MAHVMIGAQSTAPSDNESVDASVIELYCADGARAHKS